MCGRWFFGERRIRVLAITEFYDCYDTNGVWNEVGLALWAIREWWFMETQPPTLHCLLVSSQQQASFLVCVSQFNWSIDMHWHITCMWYSCQVKYNEETGQERKDVNSNYKVWEVWPKLHFELFKCVFQTCLYTWWLYVCVVCNVSVTSSSYRHFWLLCMTPCPPATGTNPLRSEE